MDKDQIERILNSLIEELAAVEHERWSHWQRYLHSKCTLDGNDGALRIPSKLAQRWQRQSETAYAELSEEEKESDREQVLKYLPIIARILWLENR